MSNKRGSLTGGLVLIAIGTAFLLERFDLVSMRQIWRLWPMIIIWFGLMNLVYPQGGRRSIFLLLIGVWLQISVLELWGLDFGDSWPLLIIFVGASFMFDAVRPPVPGARRRRRERGSSETFADTGSFEEDRGAGDASDEGAADQESEADDDA